MWEGQYIKINDLDGKRKFFLLKLKKWYILVKRNELSLCHKLKFSNSFIFAISLYKPVIVWTLIIWAYGIHSLKYLSITTLGCKDIVIRKSEFVAKSQFL